MNNLLNNKTKKGISAVKHPETNQLLNTSDSAELLNEYFVCIAQKLVDNLPLRNPPMILRTKTTITLILAYALILISLLIKLNKFLKTFPLVNHQA